MGPGSDGSMAGMGGMEPHHMNGSLGKTAEDGDTNKIMDGDTF